MRKYLRRAAAVVVAAALASLFGAVAIDWVSAADQNFVVNTSDDVDDGSCDEVHCSLREAMKASNADPGHDTISFAIGDGPHTIAPLVEPLPQLGGSVTIDGTTQPGYDGAPLIAIDGVNLSGPAFGLVLGGAASVVRGVAVVRFAGGIHLSGGDSRIEASYVGVGLDGTTAPGGSGGISIASSSNTIGGAEASARNLISGNSIGIQVTGGSANEIVGNYIGTDATGVERVPNSVAIRIQGGNGTVVEENVVSGNAHGIQVQGFGSTPTATVIRRNRIGLAASSASPLGNGNAGVLVEGVGGTPVSGVTVGGSGEEANLIAFNAWGVRVGPDARRVTISANSIYENTQLGIDLEPLGVTGNDVADVDEGPNDLQNYPVLQSAEAGETTRVSGTLDSRPAQGYRLDFYASAACDPSAHGEGERWLGSVNVITSDGGDTSFDTEAALGPSTAGEVVTATATDPDGNTSEFSACVTAGETGEPPAPPDFVVRNTNDSGAGSLRQAILDANENEGHDTITFAIDGEGPHVITLESPLPAITDPVTIDGYTQPGSQPNASDDSFTGKLQIVLTGLPFGWDGASAALALQTSGSTIRGLIINGGFDDGVSIAGPSSSGNVVAGNAIGINPGCQITQDRSIVGETESTIEFDNESGTTVDVYWLDYDGSEVYYNTLAPGQRYEQPTWLTHPWVIRTSGGDCLGYELSDSLEKTYVIEPPPPALGVLRHGISVAGAATGNVIGGPSPADRNVISSNADFLSAGVALTGGAIENEVAGNLIGTDGTGKRAFPNTFGILIEGSSSNLVQNNVVSGNIRNGITVRDPVDESPNHSRFNEIRGNLVGTDVSGTQALGNGRPSIGGDGIQINRAGENYVGGPEEGDGNVVAASAGHGIFLFDTTEALVQGNSSGTNAAGTAALANGIDGIAVDGGGNHQILDNLTSGNTNQGIAIFSVPIEGVTVANVVQGNRVGTDAAGTGPIANGGDGVLLSRAYGTLVGGDDPEDANTIAYNGAPGRGAGAGVIVFSGTGNAIHGNSIRDNRGLGIDLAPRGVTSNDVEDADEGPNRLQNFPELERVVFERDSSDHVNILASVDAHSDGVIYRIDYYASDDCDPSGHGEGARHLGHDLAGGSGGSVEFDSTSFGPVAPGDVLTATVTDHQGNTSEFSACLSVPEAAADATIALTAEEESVEAGAARVRYRDVPLSVFTRPAGGGGGTTGSAPLDAIPLDAIPLDAIPLDAIPLDAIPLDAIGLDSALLENALGGVPLTFVPLNPVSVPGGWDAVLANTALAGRPILTITLAEVFALQPLPDKPNGEKLSLADLDLANSPFGDLPLVALILGPIAIEDIPLDPESTGESQNLADWCAEINAQPGFDCANSGPLAGTTLMALSLAGLPLDAIPLDAIPLDAIPLDAIPLDAIPLDAIPLDAILMKGSPLDAIPLDAILLKGTPLDAIPLDAIPLDAIGIGQVPLDAIPLDAIPLDAILLANSPLDAIPLDSIPLDAIGLGSLPLDAIGAAGIPLDAIVVCGGSFNCQAANVTLAHAYAAGAIKPEATLGDLAGALAEYTLGDIRVAGNQVPDEVAKYTLADLKAYGDVTLGELLFYGDVTLGEILAEVPGLTLGDLLLALLSPQAYPWEKLPYERLRPQLYAFEGSRVTYSGSFSISGDVAATSVVVKAELPPGFSYVPGTATFEFPGGDPEFPISGIRILEDDEVEVDGRTLTFSLAGIEPGRTYRLELEARPSIVLGIGTASATAKAAFGPESAPSSVNTTVTETFPGNGHPGEAPELADDSYYLSHIVGRGDVDYYRFPLPAAGSRVTVRLSHLAADFDLAVYGPDRLEQPRNAPAAVPLDAIPLGDDGAGLRPLAQSLTPEALEDIPILGDRSLWGLSINRSTEDEAVAVVSNGEEGDLTIQVSGYNGASSATPYMLRVEVQAPRALPPCPAPRTFDHSPGAPGTIPALSSLPTGLNTVFVLNTQRLRGTFGGAADTALNALGSQALAELASLGFPSAVIPVEGNATVAQAYADWDENPCAPELANRVVRSITDLLDTIRAARPTVQNVVLVGGDDIVPHARIDDATTFANEIQHAGTFPQNNQYLGAFGNWKLLTDNPYGTTAAIPFFNRHLYVPELAVGRLVESPLDIARAIGNFRTFNGTLAPQTAFTTGYDFLSDGAQEVHDHLAQLVGNGAESLISETWSSGDVRDALGAANPPSIISINAHYDHHRSLPADEHAAGKENALFTTSDVSALPQSHLDRRLLFTMGCHAGLSLSDVVVGATVPSLDWAQAFAGKGGSFAGNTGYGLGDTEVVGYTEKLLSLFAEELGGPGTIAGALNRAKQRYLALQGVVGVYDEKVMSQMTLYGLPMWRAGGASAAAAAAASTPPTHVDPVTGLEASSFSVQPQFAKRSSGASRGDYYTVTGGDVEVTHFRPLQPKLHLPVQQGARGALITHLESADEGNQQAWFDPVFSRPIIDHSSREPEISFGDTAFPTKIQTVSRGPSGGSLVLVVGQFFTPEGAPPGLGTQRRFTKVEGLVYGSSGNDDFVAPEFRRIDGVKIGTQLAFSVDVDDPGAGAGNVRRVLVLYRDQTNVWRGVDLTRGAGSVWTGGGPVTGDNVEFFAQAVDAAGNVAVSTRKGRYFDAQPVPPPPAELQIELQPVTPATELPSGWFTGDVRVVVEGPEPLEVSVDGGPYEQYTGPVLVSGNGVHRVDVRGPEGLAATVFVPIDATLPTVVIRTPANGATYILGSTVLADYACLDSGSGVASCQAPVANGAPIDTATVGTKSFTVTARDAAGNGPVTLTHTYSVIYAFSGFLPPIQPPPTLNTAKAGSTIPIKFSLGGNQGMNIFAKDHPKSRSIKCDGKGGGGQEEIILPGSRTLSYDAAKDEYNLGWKTDSKWAGTCRQLVMRLADGMTYRADFRLTK